MQNGDKKEILDAIQMLAQHVEEQNAQTRSELRLEIGERHSEVVKEILDMRESVSSMGSEVLGLRREMNDRFDSVENLFRKQDEKLDLLSEKMYLKKLLTKEDVKELLSFGPFPIAN
jgi:hypothetical protein